MTAQPYYFIAFTSVAKYLMNMPTHLNFVRFYICLQGYFLYRTSDLYQFFVDVAYGCGSVLLWQRDEIPRGRGSLGAFFPTDNAL